LIVNGNYKWSGLTTYGIPQLKTENTERLEFLPSSYHTNFINFGEFGDTADIIYEDHFQEVPSNYASI
jgi:hypothetical protein